jgi:hypothetical protein
LYRYNKANKDIKEKYFRLAGVKGDAKHHTWDSARASEEPLLPSKKNDGGGESGNGSPRVVGGLRRFLSRKTSANDLPTQLDRLRPDAHMSMAERRDLLVGSYNRPITSIYC